MMPRPSHLLFTPMHDGKLVSLTVLTVCIIIRKTNKNRAKLVFVSYDNSIFIRILCCREGWHHISKYVLSQVSDGPFSSSDILRV